MPEKESFSSLSQVKNIIAVGSGKGGVGKSTVTVNLALALAKLGYQVGILDADIYGPSQPAMLGVTEKPESKDGKTVQPMEAHGVKSMSIGYLMPEEKSPAIWRGPMASGALSQLVRDTQWGQLDFLIVDMPPGTGDIQLTLAQKVPLSGAVIVTTPQDLALLDARKAIEMFIKVDVPVLGVVENMSTHICSQCGHEEAIFGEAGGMALSAEYGVEELGRIPLALSIRQQVDQGCPSVVAEPEGDIAKIYLKVARQVVESVDLQAEIKSRKFPEVDVDSES